MSKELTDILAQNAAYFMSSLSAYDLRRAECLVSALRSLTEIDEAERRNQDFLKKQREWEAERTERKT